MKKSKFIILTMIILMLISISFAFAKYVLFSSNNVTVTLKDGTISETQITVTPSSWTNNKVAVTIESDKGGEIYYKVGQNGEWTKYNSSFDVFENDTVYSKLVFKDAEGPEALKDVTNIDKVPPTKSAPVATATSNKIVVTSKQEDFESGIVYEEYAIKKDGVWTTQQLNNFEGLKSDTVYYVKTISTDLAGNISESDELEIRTAKMTPGLITFRKDNSTGETFNVSEDIQAEKNYINNNVYFEVAQGENGKTIYKVTDKDGNEVSVNEDILKTSTGTYVVTATTTDGTNVIEKTYYIYIDKTLPTRTLPTVVATTSKIIVTNNQTDVDSGIAKVEYAIYNENQNRWNWQSQNEFSGLKPNKEYRIKTRTTDKAGNTSETTEVTVVTKELSGATIVVKENADKQKEIIPSASASDENKDWTNKDIIIDTTTEEGTTVDVVLKDNDGNVVNKKEDGSYETKDGIYEITVTTKDKDENVIEDKYYIFVDKTKPTVTINPNGKEYVITPGSTQTKISVLANGEDSGSGISKLQYAWSTSNTEEPSEWSTFVNNKVIENLVDGGTYYLWTNVVDKAGNVADQRVSNAYIVKYKIVFNANGGENAPEAQIKSNGVNLTLTEEVPTRAGYTFLGWSKLNNATVPDYEKGGIYSEDKAIQLYAVWKANEYTVTFNYNAPNYTENKTVSKTYNSKLGTLPTASRPGYVFDGWYTDILNGTKISSTTVVTTDVTYYAHWIANKYTVKYNGNGATSGTIANKEVSYDETFSLEKNVFVKTGYTFKEWNTKSNGTGTSYNENASVSNLTETADDIVNLYAIWEDKTGPNTTAPGAVSDVSSVTVTCKQTDDGSGIDETTIEYGINKNGTWEWQKDPKFTGLNSNTEYEVKTRASDKDGNGPTESKVTKIKTSTLQLGDITFKKNDENGEDFAPAISADEDKVYINTNVYVKINPSENGKTIYTVKCKGEDDKEYSEDQIIETKTGVYEITVTTKTDSETYNKTYYIYIDKTNPTSDLPTVTTTTGKITLTNNQKDNESGIAKVEYGILLDGEWQWQSTGNFEGLKENTSYEVKTRTTDKAGNVTETASMEAKTKALAQSTIKIIKAESETEVTPSTSEDDENKQWINEDIKIEITTPDGLKSEEHVYKPDGTEVTKDADGKYGVDDGTYKIVVKTKDDDGNVKEDTYYVFVDKTKPVVTVNPDGGKYIIQVGETSSNISVVINADETGSGLKTLEYAWSTSKTTVPTQWKKFVNGTPITNTVTGGTYYLWINVKDNAGNKADKIITNAYTVVYTVQYDANGGQNAPASQEKVNNKNINISATIPTKKGYTFKGWAEKASATTAKYQAGDVYSANVSIKLYAIWEANTYNITYKLNGGTFNTTQDTTYTYNKEKVLPTSDDITKPGYNFDGWYDQDGNKVSTLPAGTIDNVILEAHWTARTDTKYTVKYYLENANNSEYTLYSTEDRAGITDKILNLEDVQNPKVAIPNATYKSNNLTSITKIDATTTTVVNVYYSRNTFKLNLVAGNNISSVTGANNYKWGQTVNINAVIANDAGYTYKWNLWTSSDSSVLQNQANQKTTITMPTANVTLTASATRSVIEYTITKKVKQDGSINENKTQTIKYNVETPSFEITTDEIDGYTFKGWTLNDESQMYQTVTIEKGTTGNKTYTAVFVDETGPSNKAPTGTSTTSEITIKCNQTDNGSGINETTIEYGIYKDNEWKWQTTPTFEGLDANTSYKVKTRVKDNAGNGPVESLETTITTKSVNESTLTFRKNNSNGEVVNFPTTDDSSVWVNTNIHVTPNITQTSGITTTYKIVDSNGQEQSLNSDSILITETGKYVATITTTDGVNEKVITYYIYVDKTLPTVDIVPNGGNYYIPVGSSNIEVTSKLIAKDEGGSNLNTLQYGWSNSNITPPTVWSNFENESSISKTLSGGTSYLWTKVTDVAGNEAQELKHSAGFEVGYTIEYDANGGENAPSTGLKNHNVNYAISTSEPTKQGYTFKGWATTAQATTVEYNKSSIYSANESVRLYAVWSANTYNIVYNLNGGEFTKTVDSKYTYNQEKALPTSSDVQKPGYDFDGWYTKDGKKMTSLPVGTINDITLDAHWSARTDTEYTVYYYTENIDDNNYTKNEQLTETKTGTTDSTINLSTLEKKLEGMTCVKKAITENGENTETTTINGDGTTTIYIYYSRNKYTLTVNGNENISSTTGSGEYKYGKSVQISAVINNVKGYNYSWSGWTSSDITVPTTQKATITIPSKNVTITANANRTIQEYKISYDLAGGKLADDVSNPTTYNVESENITLNNPTKEGFVFAGWIENDVNLGTKVVIQKGTTGDKSYVASWKLNGYKVTYNYAENGGTSATKAEDIVEYTKAIDLTPTAEKEGYVFVGWNTDKNATQGLTELNMNSADVILYAIYSKEVTIKFDKNGGNEDIEQKYTVYNKQTELTIKAPETPTENSGWQFVCYGTTSNSIEGFSLGEEKTITIPENKNSVTYYSNWKKDIVITFIDYLGDQKNTTEKTVVAYNGNTTTVEAPAQSEYEEWISAGWTTSEDATAEGTNKSGGIINNISQDTTYYGVYTQDIQLKYNLNGSTSDQIPTQTATRKVNSCNIDNVDNPQMKVSEKTLVKSGYTFNNYKGSNDQKYEAGITYTFDQTIILNAEWNIEKYTIEYDLDGGNIPDSKANPKSYTIEDADIVLNEPTKQGYNFSGWKLDGEETIQKPGIIKTGSTGNKKYIAQWSNSTDTEYKIQYYYQKDGMYSNTPDSSVVKTGTTEAEVQVSDSDKVPTKSGYKFDEDAVNILSGTISPDGSLALKVYFKQQFTIRYLPGIYGTFTEQVYTGVDYGGVVPSFNGEISGRPGYTFTEWNPEVDFTATEDKTYTAEWVANTNTAYKVEYYYQTNGAYNTIADSSVTRAGTTDTAITVEDADKISTKDEYVLDESANNVFSGTIAGDGSLVLKVYFKQQFTVQYLPGDKGTFETQKTESLDYGTKTPEFTGDKTCMDGYSFSKWNPDLSQTVTANVSYIAEWVANTNTEYKIEYYYQKDGIYSATPDSTKTKQGTTDTIATVEDSDKIATKTGYVFDEDAENVLTGNINGNGSLVLKVYFKQQFTIRYLPGTKGTFESQVYENIDYGEALPEISGETTGEPGYTFNGWDSELPTVVTESKDYTAQWTANTDTQYTVEYYYQTAGVYPDKATKSVTRKGTTDSTASVTTSDKISTITEKNYIIDLKAGNVLSGTIKGDGSLVLKIYFKEQFKVKYIAGTHVKFDTQTLTVDYNAKNPSFTGTPVYDTGYGNGVWTPALLTNITEDTEYVLNATPNNDTQYKVEYYYQSSGVYSATPTSSVTRKGTTDTVASVTDEDKTSTKTDLLYVFDISASNILKGNIEADGSLVLKVYFKQQFTVKYTPGTHTTFTEETHVVDYGATTPDFEGTVKCDAGYSFKDVWTPTKASKVTKDATYVANAVANTNTKYTIHMYGENAANTNYTLIKSITKTGTTGASVTIADVVGTLDGYTYSKSKNKVGGTVITTATIKGDGTTEIFAYFTRNKYKLVLTAGNNISSVTGAGTYKWGASVTINATIKTATGVTYYWSGWTSSNAKVLANQATQKATITMPKLTTGNSITLTANASNGTANEYPIIYEGVDGVDNSANPTTYKYGTAVTLKSPGARTGYDFVNWYSDSTYKTVYTKIPATQKGTVIVYAKWKKHAYTVTYNAKGGTCSVGTKSLNYGDEIDLSPVATKTNSIFKGWSTSETGSTCLEAPQYMGASDLVLYAVYVDAVAKIGNTYYETVQDAIDSAGTAETTIEILRNVTLGQTIGKTQADQNITINLNKYTLASTSTSLATIENRGNLTLTGAGSVTSSGYVAMKNLGKGTINVSNATVKGKNYAISNNSTASTAEKPSVKLTSGTIESTGATALYNFSSGYVYLAGGTVKNTGVSSCIVSISTGTIHVDGATVLKEGTKNYAINNTKEGKIIITKGSVTATQTTAIYMKNGTITIGKNDSTVSTTSPVISGGLYGLYKTDTVTSNFYDGIIKGADGKAIYGLIDNMPTGYNVQKTTEDGIQSAILVKANYAEYDSNNNIVTYYPTLSSAFTNATSDNTIKPLKNVTETVAVTMPAEKSLILDLNGKTISISTTITNNGTLQVNDSTNKGNLKTTKSITNTGNIIVNSGNIVGSGSVQTMINDATTANITINGGVVSAVADANIVTLYNKSGEIMINGGTVTSKYRCITNTTANASITITGGTVSAVGGSKITYQAEAVYAAAGTLNVSGGNLSAEKGEYTSAWAVQSGSTAKSTITGGTFSGETLGLAIYGNADISNATVICNEGTAIINYGTETVNFTNVTTKATKAGISSIKAGKINIISGNIQGDTTGIYASLGTITLGTNETTPSVSTTVPSVVGGTYGVNIESTATFNFYDGVISAPIKQAINGTITDKPTGYDVVYSFKNDLESATLAKTANRVCKIDDVYFSTVQNAVNYAGTTPSTIEMLKSVSKAGTQASIQASQDITLDLKGFTVTSTGGGSTIVNRGKFNVEDTSTSSAGKITCTSTGVHYSINNIGTTTVTSGNIESSNAQSTVYNNGDSANFIVNGGKVSTTYNGNTYAILNNLGNVKVTKGTIQSNYRAIVSSANNKNGNVTVTGGTVKATGTANITATAEAFNVSGGTLTISGGTFVGDKGEYSSGWAGYTADGVSATITGGNFTGSQRSLVIYGDAKISNATIVGTNTSALCNLGTHVVEVTNCTIKSATSAIWNNNSKGSTIVRSGTITGSDTGIYIYAGTVTVGTNEKTPSVSTTVPSITGGQYGVNLRSGSTFNFYDGVIKGQLNKSINGSVADVPTGYGVVYTYSNDVESATLAKQDNIVCKIGNKYFTTVQNAVNYAGTTTSTIEMLKSVSKAGTQASIQATQNITLDLKGFTVTSTGNGSTIVNRGKFNVKDTSTSSAGKITCTSTGVHYSINNIGTTTVTSGNIESSNAQSTVYNNGDSANFIVNGGKVSTTYNGNTYAILNNLGNVKVTKGTIQSNYRAITGSTGNTNGNITISGGTVKVVGGKNITYQAEPFYVTAGTLNISGGTFIGENGDYTISWGGQIGEKATATITGGNFTGNTKGLGIYGKATISNATISSSTGMGLSNYGTETVTLTNNTITGNTTGVHNESTGSIVIKSGKITGTTDTGVYARAGTITLGTNESTPVVSTTTPNITGGKYGANIASSATFNFYDGIINGPLNNAIHATVSAKPTGYDVVYSYSNNIESATLAKTADRVCRIGTKYFTSIQKAINYAGTTESTIVMLKNVSQASTQGTILDGQKITLDLASYTVTTTGGGSTFVNKGTFNVKGTTGKIEATSANYAINNTGAFTLTSGTIRSTGAKNTIVNNAKTASITVNGGTISSEYDGNVVSIYNMLGDVTINKGTITSKYRCLATSLSNETGTVNVTGGTLKAVGGKNISYQAEAIYIASGTANISGGTFTGEKGEYTAGWAGQIGEKVTTTITGGKFTGETTGIGIYSESGTNQVNNATVTAKDGSALMNMNGAVLEVTNSTVSGTIGIHQLSTGNIIVNSGTITGTTQAVYSTSGNVTINGGNLSGERAIQKGGPGTILVNDGKLTSTISGTITADYDADKVYIVVRGGTVQCAEDQLSAIINFTTNGNIVIGKYGEGSKTSPVITGRIYASNEGFKDRDGYTTGNCGVSVYGGLITATTSNAIYSIGTVTIEGGKISASQAHTVILGDLADSEKQYDLSSIGIGKEAIIENTSNYYAVSTSNDRTQYISINLTGEGSITSAKGIAVNNQKGSTAIFGAGHITGYTYGVFTKSGTIDFRASLSDVNYISAIGENGVAICTETGTINIGEKYDTFRKVTPVITGKKYGVQVVYGDGTFMYGDGYIYGGTKSINNAGIQELKSCNLIDANGNSISTYYGINYSKENVDIGGTSVNCEKTQLVKPYYANSYVMIYDKNTVTRCYEDLASALNNEDTIYAINSKEETQESDYTISKNTSLFPNGKNIKLNSSIVVKKGYKLTIPYSTPGGVVDGSIESTAKRTILNNGELSIGAIIKNTSELGITASCVENTGTLSLINGASVQATTATAIRISGTGTTTINTRPNRGVFVNKTDDPEHYAIRSSSTAENAIIVERGDISGDGGILAGNVIVKRGSIIALTSNAISTSSANTSITIGDETLDLTNIKNDDYTNIPILQAKQNAINITSNKSTLNYYAGTLFGVNKAISNAGTTNVRQYYRIFEYKGNIVLNEEQFEADKVILVKK